MVECVRECLNWNKTFLADPDASFAVKYGVDGESRGVAQAYADHSIGRLNSIRFSMLVADGVVKSFNVVEDAIKDAETLLSDLRHYNAAWKKNRRGIYNQTQLMHLRLMDNKIGQNIFAIVLLRRFSYHSFNAIFSRQYCDYITRINWRFTDPAW